MSDDEGVRNMTGERMGGENISLRILWYSIYP